MTEAKHSELPWRATVARTLIHIGNANNGVCAISVSPPRIPERDLRDAMVECAKADAELIVRSVNALPELVSALEGLVYAARNQAIDMQVMQQARDALQKARKP